MEETNDIGELKALILTLLAKYEPAETENAALHASIAHNSSNSHKPPAAGGYAQKPLIKSALPKVVCKKVSGQPVQYGSHIKKDQWCSRHRQVCQQEDT